MRTFHILTRMTKIITVISKAISRVSKLLNLGSGETWPGEIALKLDPNILAKISPENIVLIAGTNGKTTTALMIKTILENGGKKMVHNASGANLLNGIVSAVLISPKTDWGVFEIDENTLPQVLKYVEPRVIVLLNLFRDQLDRYGEVDTIAAHWKKALENYSGQLVLNADDPQIAVLGNKKSVYFGLDNPTLFQKTPEHAMDSQFCPHCGHRLKYQGTYYSHIGVWHCPSCQLERPKPSITAANYPLPGVYNRYNTLAAIAVARVLNLPVNLENFSAAFGRQEQIGNTRLFLSKNPAGFNESLRTVLKAFARPPLANGSRTIQLLLVLNDRIPDGRDVSWIWDVDFEMIPKNISLAASGDRAFDLALRLKYAGLEPRVVKLVDGVKKAESILATYSAMLEVRKILTGKKIL